MRISDWSSDVCSSDLCHVLILARGRVISLGRFLAGGGAHQQCVPDVRRAIVDRRMRDEDVRIVQTAHARDQDARAVIDRFGHQHRTAFGNQRAVAAAHRSEEHTSELQSLMRISYAVFCLNKQKTTEYLHSTNTT